MSDEVTEPYNMARPFKSERSVSREHYDWMVGDRDEWKQCATVLEGSAQRVAVEIQRLTAERDAAREELDQVRKDNHGLAIDVQDIRAGLEVVTAERDAARADSNTLTMERDRAQSHLQSMIRKADHLVAERDAAQDETHKLREQYAKLYSENEGLRADLMAHPPSYHQELAIERKRHLELIEDYNLQATMIETLQEGLKRTESLLAKAQGQDIDPRLRGFLATISQLADQSQDMIP